MTRQPERRDSARRFLFAWLVKWRKKTERRHGFDRRQRIAPTTNGGI